MVVYGVPYGFGDSGEKQFRCLSGDGCLRPPFSTSNAVDTCSFSSSMSSSSPISFMNDFCFFLFDRLILFWSTSKMAVPVEDSLSSQMLTWLEPTLELLPRLD